MRKEKQGLASRATGGGNGRGWDLRVSSCKILFYIYKSAAQESGDGPFNLSHEGYTLILKSIFFKSNP